MIICQWFNNLLFGQPVSVGVIYSDVQSQHVAIRT